MNRHKCHECGAELEDAVLDKRLLHTRKGETVLVTNVPIERCPRCRNVCFPARVCLLFERIRAGEIVPDPSNAVELAAIPFERLLVSA